MTTKQIKRNADGQQSIKALRRELAADKTRSVHLCGGNWIVGELIDDCWHQTTCPFWWSERQAIQSALFGEVETPEEAQYHAVR